MKTCNTCKYKGRNILISIFSPKSQLCYRPNRKIDLATGSKIETFVDIERNYDVGCGKDGIYHSDIFPIKVQS